ncbi:hypothetical protein MMC25_007517 [Agyrium rufum]|nr:hypothetical protein [Agyrium rufum]
MTHLVSSLTKRGVDAVNGMVNGFGNDENGEMTVALPTWGITLLAATVTLYFAVYFSLSYTFSIVETLLVVESTSTTTIAISPPKHQQEPDAPLSYDEKDGISSVVQEEILVIRSQPITAKIGTTTKYLRAQAGYASRFRGLLIFVVSLTLNYFLTLGLLSIVPGMGMVSRMFVSALASAILCRFQAAWTHIVISQPSSKRWYQRLPVRSNYKKLFFPTLLHALAIQASVYIPRTFWIAAGLQQYMDDPSSFGKIPVVERNFVVFQAISIFIIAVLCVFVFAIPASVVLTRVQAALLPVEDKAIIPFDRTFDGKFVTESDGGCGRLSVKDAWKTFDISSRVRLMKFYVKTLAIHGVLAVLFGTLLVTEVQFILGDQLPIIMASARASMAGTN